MASRFVAWFTERWPIRAVLRWSLEENIPGGASFWYSLGAATLFVFVIQVVTGVWQMFWYVPTTDHAYQSVMYIRREVPFGWLLHGLHAWGSSVFLVLMSLHLVRVFVWGAYKRPRQLIWLLGVLLFFTVVALSFTGALLPWDELGYWAAEVGTSIAGTVPLIGSFLKQFMRGGAALSQETLSRFFIGHIAILPSILAALLIAHLVAFRQYGSVGPWKEQKRRKAGWFWPDQILKDLVVVVVIFVTLVGLTAFWRAPITGPADPIDNIITPKPEWQFLFLYQFLKLFKGRWEPVGTVGVPLALFFLLFLLPFYDRNQRRRPLHRPIAMAAGIALVAWLWTYTYLGFVSRPAPAAVSITVSSSASPGVQAGAKLFTGQGCIACHMVHGQGGDIGPNLSNIGAQGLSRAWLTEQIRDPKSHDPQTMMPAFDHLSDPQVSDLVDFLESLGGRRGRSSLPSSSAGGSTEPNALSRSSSSASGGEESSALIQRGRQLFHSQPCLDCHRVNGQGGNVGPDLSNEGAKGHSSQWLTQQIRDPRSHNAQTTMPAFQSLNDQQVQALVAYLGSLGASGKSSAAPLARSKAGQPEPTSSPPLPSSAPPSGPGTSREPNLPSAGAQGPPGRAAYLVGEVAHGIGSIGAPMHGKLLYDKWCEKCHGRDGRDDVKNPGSVRGRVPPLDPIAKPLFSEDPVTFAENIDRYLQHGSMPRGSHPEKYMPAFGDDFLLTQEMISEIEAYVLKLNGVDRAEIVHPGLAPEHFSVGTIIVFGVICATAAIWFLVRK